MGRCLEMRRWLKRLKRRRSSQLPRALADTGRAGYEMSHTLAVHTVDNLPGGEARARRITPRHETPYRVVVHGLRHFCEKLPGLLTNDAWDVRDRSRHSPAELAQLVRELRNCDLIFSWGGRLDMGPFLWAAKSLGTPKIVIFWCGSDVLRARTLLSTRQIDPWIARQIHWAASPILAEEVRSMEIDCEFVQASFVEAVRDPKPLPGDFSVLAFLPRVDAAEIYGGDRVLNIAKALPSVRFKLIGLHPGQEIQVPPNVSVHQWTADPRPLYEDSTVLLRPVRHDAGISFMVLEALSHGRHVLYTYPVPGGIQIGSVEEAVKQIEHLRVLHDSGSLPLNCEGIKAVKQTYSRDVVRQELHTRWEEIICS